MVAANLLAADTSKPLRGEVVNIAGGRAHLTSTILVVEIGKVFGRTLEVRRIEPRPGDIRHSLADISRAHELHRLPARRDLGKRHQAAPSSSSASSTNEVCRNPVRSMTGFGLGSSQVSGAAASSSRSAPSTVAFSTVRVRMPRELADLSVVVETEASERLSRGRCDIVVRIEGTVPSRAVDRQGAGTRTPSGRWWPSATRYLPGADVPLSILAAVPDAVHLGARYQVRCWREGLGCCAGRRSTIRA